jgi:hypothetical protein
LGQHINQKQFVRKKEVDIGFETELRERNDNKFCHHAESCGAEHPENLAVKN